MSRQVQRAAPGISGPGQLGDDRFRFGGNSADPPGQQRDPQEQHAQDGRHPDQGDAGVAAARLLEGGDAVRDRLHAGQGRRAAGKGAQDQEQGDPPGQSCSRSMGGGSTTVPSEPVRYRTRPTPTVRNIIARKK